MEGYSGSDIRLVCKEAAMRLVRTVFDSLESHQNCKAFIKKKKKKIQTDNPPRAHHSQTALLPHQVLTFPPSSWEL